MEVLVTFLAGERCVLVGRSAMTFFAGNRRMQADQRKARQFVIERQVPPPIRIIVASFAALAQFALMRIVLAMTGDASCSELVAVEISAMAGVAFDLGVCAPQRKFGLVVVEMDCLPLALVMTGFAFGAIAAGVDVLQAVTGDTGGRQVLVELAGMRLPLPRSRLLG